GTRPRGRTPPGRRPTPPTPSPRAAPPRTRAPLCWTCPPSPPPTRPAPGRRGPPRRPLSTASVSRPPAPGPNPPRVRTGRRARPGEDLPVPPAARRSGHLPDDAGGEAAGPTGRGDDSGEGSRRARRGDPAARRAR